MTAATVVRTVLLVEDDPSLRDAIVRALARRSFAVTAVATGSEAIEAAREFVPDAVIMDVFLPDAGGLGVARELRRQPSLAAVPVLFITGLSLPSVRDALAPAPVLFKPFRFGELMSSLRLLTREG